MSSIKFDDVEILNTTYMPQFVKHETAPDRQLISVPLARDDGEVLIATRYGKKVIQLRGTLRANSQALLDAAIDDFKELFSRPEKNFDISWESGTLRYVATCRTHSFDRDHYHLSAVPWSAEFVVSSGVGKATTATLALNEEALTTDDTDVTGTFIAESSFTLDGSKAAAPVITLEIVSADADMKGIEYKNVDTGERIVITRNVDWSAAVGKKVIIDCENKRVTDNLTTTDQVEGPFFGVFPRFKIGTNNVQITSGGFVNQRSSEDAPSNVGFISYTSTSTIYAVSFQVPYADDTFGGAILGLSKSGTPAGNLFVRMVPDAGGLPDYGASSIAAATIAPSAATTYPTFSYVPGIFSAAASLNPNTTYWLVVGAQSGDVSNHFYWHTAASITYPRGHADRSLDSGTTWDGGVNVLSVPSFRILMGGVGAATGLKHTVSYPKTYL